MIKNRVGELDLKAIQSTDLPTLARVFSTSVFNDLAKKSYSPTLNSILKELKVDLSESKNLNDFFDTAYELLLTSYRNEYLYKNTITNKLLLGKHSLNTSALLTEFRISSSKADVLILNGTSHIYEIKSELDSLDRLEKQLCNYAKFAEYVHVVTSSSHIDKLLKTTSDKIGILELTSKNTLKTIRKSQSNIDNLSLEVIFESLRQVEYSNIIKQYYGFLPEVPNSLMFQECKKLFERLPKKNGHKLVIETLKKRNSTEHQKSFIHSMPKSLKALAVSTKYSKNQINNLSKVLSECII